MGKEIAVAALAFWKSREEFQDPVPKINRQGQDRAKLNDDGVHLPETIVQVQVKKRFDDTEMAGGADRQKFGQAFNNSQQDRQQKIIHRVSSFSEFQRFSVSAFQETASAPCSSVRIRIASCTS